MTVNIINEYTKSFSSDDVANGSTISKRVFAANRLFMTAGLAVLIAVGGISACSVQETDKTKHATSQSKADSTDQPPKFEQNEGYVSVRQKMIGAGWSPYHSPSADVCGEGDVRCKDRPEMEACAGSGMANCRFLWQKDGKKVAIDTVGEDVAFNSLAVVDETLPRTASSSQEEKTVTLTGRLVRDENEIGVKLANPIVVDGDDLCGKQTVTTAWLWEKNESLTPLVGQSVQISGEFSCPRGGYVLKNSKLLSSSTVVSQANSQQRMPRGVYRTKWRVLNEVNESYFTYMFGDNGEYVRMDHVKYRNDGHVDLFAVIAGVCRSVNGQLVCRYKGAANGVDAVNSGHAEIAASDFKPVNVDTEITDQIEFYADGSFRSKRVNILNNGRKRTDLIRNEWDEKKFPAAQDYSDAAWKVVGNIIPSAYLH